MTKAGGCRPVRSTSAAGHGGRPSRSGRPASIRPWTEERILVERAHLLRRLGRFARRGAAWEAIGAGAGPLSALAWIELAKLREHRLRDRPGAVRGRGAGPVRRRAAAAARPRGPRRSTGRSPGG